MIRLRGIAGAAGLAALVAALAGCGVGPGRAAEGEARLTVTRDYGAETLAEAALADPAPSDTVIRLLDRETDIATRYGGGFVQSIEGIAGGIEDGRSVDWFFFVNGVESPLGAAEVEVQPGDAIWWDHRDWTDVMRVPAVVGQFPEPFEDGPGPEADPVPVRTECRTAERICAEVDERLPAGPECDNGAGGDACDRDARALRVLVGPWDAIRGDAAGRLVERGPAASGVFARWERTPEGLRLAVLDERLREAGRHGAGTGLVAATVAGGQTPTWLVTGSDPAGVRAAAGMLEPETLRGSYALAVAGDETIPLPAR